MINISKVDIAKTLIEEGYNSNEAEIVSEEIVKIDETLEPYFYEWWNKKPLSRIKINDISVQDLEEKFKLKPLATILTLDWLIKEPEKAKSALKYGKR